MTTKIKNIDFIHQITIPFCAEDGDGVLKCVNKAYLNLLDAKEDEIIGTKAGPTSAYFCTIDSRGRVPGEKRYTDGAAMLCKLTTSKTKECVMLATASCIENKDGKPFTLWSLCDISLFVSYEKELEEKHRDLRRQQTALEHLATIDPLTGASNRRSFYDKAKELVTYAEIGGLNIGVLMIDLDSFKKLNDTHGHAAGDEALVKFANLVRKCTRATDVFARLGGEEFAVLLPDANEDATKRIATRIIEMTAANPVKIDGNNIYFTTSIGCAMWLQSEDKIDLTLNRADKRLYHAKQKGGNQFQFDSRFH